MKKITQYLALSLMVLFGLYSCSGGGAAATDGYVINGVATNFPTGTKVFLEHIEGGLRPVAIDTATIDADGKFSMTGKMEKEGIGRIKMGQSSVLTILSNSPYEVKLDARNQRENSISGNKEAEQMQELIGKMSSRQATPDYLRTFADTIDNVYLAYMAVNNLKAGDNLSTYEKLNERLKSELPDDPMTKEFEKRIASEKQKAQALAATAVGQPAAMISAPDRSGADLPLASLAGKVVLIDFWASWCGPCRRENPHVVEAYKKYNKKGFEVYSVSLDNNKDRWLKAIEKDNLVWDSHVSELKKWNSQAAAAYGVKSIPATFLIDQDGKIVGKNLRGSQLTSKLKEIFGA